MRFKMKTIHQEARLNRGGLLTVRKSLLPLALFVIVSGAVIACASIPTSDPAVAEHLRNASGGYAFLSPIETPIPGVTPIPGQITPPVVINLALSTPIMVNQPVTLTISVQANVEIVNAALGFGLETESAGFLEVYTMTLPSLTQSEVMEVTQVRWMPHKEGRYGIVASLTDGKPGGTYGKGLYFAVSGGNVVFNPTPGPPVAATVEVIGKPTSLPTRTR